MEAWIGGSRMSMVSYDDGPLSLDEADRRLSVARQLLQEACRLKRQVDTLCVLVDFDLAQNTPEKEKIKKLVSTLTVIMDELEMIGAYVKDLDVGIIDFLGKFQGQEIFYCFHLGDKKIIAWHDIHEACSRRNDIIEIQESEKSEGRRNAYSGP